ncbi:MAG TPA: copper homeostasis protein CutC [Dongiaceae bacterium]|jgi:copper homeostasis protein|nr:copper homeostasis protein CutC [Dongiaceae bacterium]
MTGLTAEICIDSVDGAIAAVEAGANRVELCANLLEGGTTPSLGLMETTIARAKLPVQVMIRPRGGDFLYSEIEVEMMLRDIAAAKAARAGGVVFGCLTADGGIDAKLTEKLIAAARPLSVTFHRAFDVTRDPVEALQTLIGLGIDRLLTSGQEPNALEGAPLIRRLIELAAGRLIVMPGGGVTARNVARIVQETGAAEIHFAALSESPSGMSYRNPHVFMGGELRPAEYARLVTTKAGIRSILDAAR